MPHSILQKWSKNCHFWPFVWFSGFVFQQLGGHFPFRQPPGDSGKTPSGGHADAVQSTDPCTSSTWTLIGNILKWTECHPRWQPWSKELGELMHLELGTWVSPHQQNLGQLFGLEKSESQTLSRIHVAQGKAMNQATSCRLQVEGDRCAVPFSNKHRPLLHPTNTGRNPPFSQISIKTEASTRHQISIHKPQNHH